MIINRTPPINLKKEDEWIYNPLLTYEIPDPKVIVVKDAYFNSEGYVWTSSGEEFVTDSCIDPKYIKVPSLTIPQKKSVVNIHEPVIIYQSNWNHNYHHYWCDSIIRLTMLENKKDVMVVLSSNDRNPYRDWVLTKMGFNNRMIANSNQLYKTNLLFLPIFNKYYMGKQQPEMIHSLRKTFINSNCLKDKIYIKRDDRLTQESMYFLDKTAEQYGYTFIRSEEYSYEKQIEIFSKAKSVVGIHGAGLTNMLWCSPHTKLLEIRNRKDNSTAEYYYGLANTLSLDFYYLMGDFVKNTMPDMGTVNTARSIMSLNEKDIVNAFETIEIALSEPKEPLIKEKKQRVVRTPLSI